MLGSAIPTAAVARAGWPQAVAYRRVPGAEEALVPVRQPDLMR